jgi:outer membrane protein assembly factor BamB
MCSTSTNLGETKLWCGMGWTGQPAVREREDGVTEVIFGAYDGAVHFVDGATGEPLRTPFRTGDLIKGSVTVDPDGYQLLYFGSRDNKLRILALDRDTPTELWSLDAYAVDGIWNDDWDANPLIVDDIMYEGGENGWFFVYRLNRGVGPDGLVTIDPELLFSMRGYDDELVSRSGTNVSIESSTTMSGGRVYFANSGGRILGLDISRIEEGEAPVVFDYYAGGDIDATIVADEEGFLYASIEHEPSQMGSAELARNREVGQLIKLDPFTDGDPLVWGLDLRGEQGDSGLWATPALYGDMLYVNTHTGDLIAVDKETGDILWSDEVGFHSWSSPAVVDGTLVVATCSGELRGYSLADPQAPAPAWSIRLGEACLEATPAIWEGTIYLGSRDGYIRAFR